MSYSSRSKNILVKAVRISLKIILILLIVIVLLVILVQTPFVQNYARSKAESWLQAKIGTKVTIGNVYIGFPKTVEVKNVYLEDQQKDTLFAADRLAIDISLFKLLSHRVEITDVDLSGITVKVKRSLPDTVFNFQYIINAFNSGPKTVDTTPSKPWEISVRTIDLQKFHVVYKDVVTGNDADIIFLRFLASIDRMDIYKQDFHIGKISVENLQARVYQAAPITKVDQQPKQPEPPGSAAPFLLQLDEVSLTTIALDYKSIPAALSSQVQLGKLMVHPGVLDLERHTIAIKDILLDTTTASVALSKKIGLPATHTLVDTSKSGGWIFRVGNLSLDRDHIRFDDSTQKPQGTGMDYSHIDARDLSLGMKDFYFGADSVSGTIYKAQVTEKSGFVLNRLQTRFLYTNDQAYLKDLVAATPGSLIRRSLSVKYGDLKTISKRLGDLQLDIDLPNSRVQVKDILYFAPALAKQPAFSNPAAFWTINGSVKGPVRNLQIPSLQISGLSGTQLAVSGQVNGLPDAKKISGKLAVQKFISNRKDLVLLVGEKSIPQNIAVPQSFSVTGAVEGDGRRAHGNLVLTSSSGGLKLGMVADGYNDIRHLGYDVNLQTVELDLGKLLKDQKQYGKINAVISLKGSGTDKQTADAHFHGEVESAVIKQYEYTDFKIDGSIAHQLIQVNAAIHDSSIDLALDAKADVSQKYPGVQLELNIDSLKTKSLHLTDDLIIYRGKIKADWPVTDPDHLEGNLSVTQSLFVRNEKRFMLDSIALTAGASDSGRYIHLGGDMLSVLLQGHYRLSEIGYVVQESIQPYFSVIHDSVNRHLAPYDFRMTAEIYDRPVWKAIFPALENMDSINFASHFSNSNGWNASLLIPRLLYGSNNIDRLKLTAATGGDSLQVKLALDKLKVGSSVELDQTNLDAAVRNNAIHFALQIRDRAAKTKYRLAGVLQQQQQDVYAFSLLPDQLLLNYDSWKVNQGNKIVYAKSGIQVTDFQISKGNEELHIASTTQVENAPLDVSFKQFRIATLSGFIQSDSTLADGVLDGRISVNNITTKPSFTSDLKIQNLTVRRDTVGDMHMLVSEKEDNTLATDISITGHGNDVQLKGNYYIEPVNGSNFALDLDMRRLQLKSVEGPSGGMIRGATGEISGKFSLGGTSNAPQVRGNLVFQKAGFNIAMLNNYFYVDGKTISVDQEGVRFDHFIIQDTSKSELELDGIAKTTDFKNYTFDLRLHSKNFQALNSRKRDNKLYYGKLFFDSDLTIQGTDKIPKVDGRIGIADSTNMTIVMPQKEPGVEDRQGIVRFVDMRNLENDSLFIKSVDSLNVSSLHGMDVSVNITISKKAGFKLVIDEDNGDQLFVKGEATLNAGIDLSGKINLTGTYDLSEGSYEVNFNLLHRKFDIQKGSTITWTGEPTKANIDIKAIYIAQTQALDLIQNQLSATTATTDRNLYRQKLPFEVHLNMTGELLQPQIAFDIILPDDKNYQIPSENINTIEAKLTQIRTDPSELNKQVFALLLLGRFVGENPFESSGGGLDATEMAKASVSKILADQLNQLAGSLAWGVDVNFDVNSTQDYSTGNKQDRTDLNVGLSKRLLNDRLVVSVDSDFQLEGQNSNQNSMNMLGNIAVDYQLSKDGRYMLRAYRKNSYQGIIEGYVVETGVGFIFTIDYNHLKDIFRKKNTGAQKNKNQQSTATGSAAKESTGAVSANK